MQCIHAIILQDNIRHTIEELLDFSLMTSSADLQPIDYLLVGHITHDLVDSGVRLGGTVTFAGLTLKAMGYSVGIVTSCKPDTDLSSLRDIQVVNIASECNTTFKNQQDDNGRKQFLYQKANAIQAFHIPEIWQKAEIVHLGPVANEIDVMAIDRFPHKFLCLTPQGWLRETDSAGRVHPLSWQLPDEITAKAAAIVLSTEDVQADEGQIMKIASLCPILVVTENKNGARVYWKGDNRHFAAPQVPLVEDTGAGDIFAAAFFSRLHKTWDPWEAARFAVQISAFSVTRKALESIPTASEINAALMEIIV